MGICAPRPRRPLAGFCVRLRANPTRCGARTLTLSMTHRAFERRGPLPMSGAPRRSQKRARARIERPAARSNDEGASAREAE